MAFLQNIIRGISPKWALERERADLLLEAMGKARKYSGATFGPLAEDWLAPATSAKAETSQDIILLRNRMRELVRNDGYANKAVHALANNIVGKGIRPSIKSESKRQKDKVENTFLEWCNSLDADFYGRVNFFGLQQLAMKGTVESGDVLLIKRIIGKGEKARLSIQLLESDYIVHWYTNMKPIGKTEGTYVLNGIYFDEKDRVTGYEIYHQHPGDSIKYANAYTHDFVSIDDCILLFRPDRPGQHRGVPVAHSVMLEHKMLSQYELAQSHRQTIAASFAAFITTTQAEQIGGANSPSDRTYPDMTGERIRPGSIQYLHPGETVELSRPPKVDDFDEYVKAKLRKMACGWGLSYEELSGDLSNVNFSSGRMGWIAMQRNIESWQRHVMIPKVCNTIWKWWVELEQMKGALPINEGVVCEWTAPRREMIDPVKETKAMIEQIQAGIKSYPEAIREMGGDAEVLMKSIAESNSKLDSYKLTLSSDYRVINAQKEKNVAPNAIKDGGIEDN